MQYLSRLRSAVFISSADNENLFIGKVMDGFALWDKLTENAVGSFIDPALPC